MEAMMARAIGGDPGPAVPPSTLSHYVLRTPRLAQMKDWYCTVLAAHVVFENPHAAFLTFDDEHHRVALVGVDGVADANTGTAGLDHAAFTYRDLGDLIRTYLRLKDAGIEPRWCVNHRVTTSFYYQDPDGNRVELTFENYTSAEELTEAMNINGRKPTALFEPESLIAHYNSGAPLEQFRDRDLGGPSHIEILRDMGLNRSSAA
jgi:catechol-2,3-dioxygenase